MKGLYLIGIIITILYDFIKNKKEISPLCCFIGPYAIIIIFSYFLKLQNLISENYIKHIFEVAILWLIISRIIIIIFSKNKISKKITKKKKYSKKIYYLSLLTIFSLSMLQLLTGLKYGFLSIKGKHYGIFAHLYNLTSTFYLAYFLEFLNKKTFIKMIVIIFFSFLCVLGSKLEAFIIFVPLFIYYYEKRQKNILLLVYLFVFSMGIFYISYFIKFHIKEGFSIIEFHQIIKEYYKIYLFSPLIIGSKLLEEPINPNGINVTFSYLINSFNFLFEKNFVSPVLNFYVIAGIRSNVGGMIAEVFYNLGIIFGWIYIIIIGFFSYFIQELYKKNENWFCLYYYMKGILVLCFFNNVFSLLTYNEKLFGSFIISLILIKIKKNRSNL